MATNDVNIAEDAEMAECDGDKVVTMMDVLQEQQEFEEDANAVLGASDDKNCTYSKGYIKRQALYACLTCCSEAKVDPTKRAGVCLACSLMCHENHDLIELYTKRNFKCDCGNPKFNSHPCQFTPEKTELNDGNTYNQNFSGLYCTCQRPYPDPESTVEDDMIQCIICEDWLHASHLEAVVPANDQYSEMVCKNCMEKNDFLHDYSRFAVTFEAAEVDIVGNGDADLNEKSVDGIKENKTEIATTSVTVNHDVKMDDDKVIMDKATNSTENKKDEENVAAETNKETKQDDKSNVESIELKHEEEPIELKHKEKLDNEAIKMDLDTESQIAKVEEQSVGISETNIPINIEAPAEPKAPAEPEVPAEPQVSENDEGKKETIEDTSEKTNGKSDIAENTPITNSEQNKDTTLEKTESTVEEPKNPDSTDDKMESIDNESEQADKIIKEQNEEQSSKHSISDEVGDGDNVQGNKTDASERTEQQQLTTLTADNLTSAEQRDADPEVKAETAIEEKSVESMTQKTDEKKDVQTGNKESPKETVNASGEYNEKPVHDDKTTTGNIEVPDTSQSEIDSKENAEEKTDAVMKAIDELSETANKAKEKETENKAPSSESKENKEKVDTIETKESGNVEKSATKKILDDEGYFGVEFEKTEDNIKSNATGNIEMSNTTENEPVSEIKVEPETDPENKDANDAEATKMNEDKLYNKSVLDEQPVVTDTVNAGTSHGNLEIVLKTNNELKTSNGHDSTNKSEPKDENEVPNASNNGKENKRKINTSLTDDTSSKKAKKICERPTEVKRVHKGATFWPSNFRQKLCTCAECLSMYKDLKVLFLTDLEDTVFAYERLGKENVAGGASQYEKGMQALSSLDRIQQINALTEYNRMRDKLLDYLKSFRDRKEVVREEHIKAFFAGMRPRREPDGVYFL